MEVKINESALCVLRMNSSNLQLKVDYVKIERAFNRSFQQLFDLCTDTHSSLDQIASFIRTNKDIKCISGDYLYCEKLDDSHTEFSIKHDLILKEILELKIKLKNKNRINYEQFADDLISNFKSKLLSLYKRGQKAYSIQRAYDLCKAETNILVYSHRESGWSHPKIKIAHNISVEIGTNFGYGHSSYFNVTLIFKGLKILPYSKWIEYRIAKFEELIRCTRSYSLNDNAWFDVLEFVKDATTLANDNENKFLKDYIVDECERLVSGLENLYKSNLYTFKKGVSQKAKETIGGDELTHIKIRKIAESLRFIRMIKSISNVGILNQWVERLESLNRALQPIIEGEITVISKKIAKLKEVIRKQEPERISIEERMEYYDNAKSKHKRYLMRKGKEERIEQKLFDKDFVLKFPEYNRFLSKHKSFMTKYQQAVKDSNAKEMYLKDLVKCNNMILKHFKY